MLPPALNWRRKQRREVIALARKLLAGRGGPVDRWDLGPAALHHRRPLTPEEIAAGPAWLASVCPVDRAGQPGLPKDWWPAGVALNLHGRQTLTEPVDDETII